MNERKSGFLLLFQDFQRKDLNRFDTTCRKVAVADEAAGGPKQMKEKDLRKAMNLRYEFIVK